jgi:hypothetical protein
LRVTTTRGFFLTDMSCSHEAVQTSLTRLFDTAVAAWFRRFLGFPMFPWESREGFGRVLVEDVPSSLARWPGQDKNPGKTPAVARGKAGRGRWG